MSEATHDESSSYSQPALGGSAATRAAARAEQRHCWRQGNHAPVEDYLGRHPDLRADPEAVLDLIYNEVVLREELGEAPQLEEYLIRFPQFAAPLRAQFDVHRALEGGLSGGSLQSTAPSGFADSGSKAPQHAAEGVGVPGYEVLEELGRGGMGVVYRAHDPDLHRSLAVKVLLPEHHGDANLERRFLEEAQLLGQLQHPGVPPVHELGRLTDGRPFFAMKLVQGRTLAELLAERRNPTENLPRFLRIVIQACEAVAYAHARGVIHRDLKPSNAMVGAFGEVQVMDWGLAKVLPQEDDGGRPESASASVVRTVRTLTPGSESQTGNVVGTLAYMPPEQACGRIQDLDARADVFSLGAVLYEVLTGQPPYRSQGNILETLLQVQSGEFPRPRALRKDVPAALEAVCLEAMALRPEDRYTTALALAAEVEHWLVDEPVSAYPEPWRVRAWRWLRRHPARTAAGMVTLLAAGVVAVVAAVLSEQGRRAVDAQRQNAEAAAEAEQEANATAQRRLRQIEKGNEILASVFTDLDPRAEEKEGKPLRAILGERLTKAAEQLEGEAIGDPLAVAGLQNRLGLSLLHLGSGERTMIALHTKALATRAASLGPDHPDTLTSMNNLALAYHSAGQLDLALPLFEKALQLRKAKLGADQPGTLASMSNLASCYRDASRLDRALPLYEETLRLRRAKLGADHPDTLMSMSNLAEGYRAAGQLGLALPLFVETLNLQKAKLGTDHYDTLESMNNLAGGYKAAGQLDLALPLLEETVQLRKAKLGADHPSTLNSMSNLADCYRVSGQVDRALPLMKETLNLQKTKLGADHPDTLASMNNLALTYWKAGQLDSALPLLEETLKLMKAKRGYEHSHTLTSMNSLAVGYYSAGRLDRALPLFEETVQLSKAKLGADHPDTLTSMSNLADCYRAAGQLARALPLMQETLTLRKAKLGADHPDTLTSMNNLAVCYGIAGKLELAQPLLEETLQLTKAKQGADHPDTLNSMNNLARCLYVADKLDLALPLFQEAATGMEKRQFRSEYADVIVHNLIDCHERLKQYDQAEAWQRKWLAVVKAGAGDSSLPYAEELAGLGRNLLAQKNWAESEMALRECLAICEKTEPDAWTTFYTRSLLGEALIGQQKYAEAEPLLLQGYQGLQARAKQIPAAQKRRPAEAAERLVRLYDAWGKPEKAGEWLRVRESLPPPTKAKPAAPKTELPK